MWHQFARPDSAYNSILVGEKTSICTKTYCAAYKVWVSGCKVESVLTSERPQHAYHSKVGRSGCTSALFVSILPHSDDASGGATPQLPPGRGHQHSDAANAMGLPAVQDSPCQGYARLGVQGKGTDLAIIVPRP